MSKVSLIIRCFNEEKHIDKLLHGIMQQTHKDLEIVMVDSGSTDKTLEIAGKYPVKIVSISPEEFSFGRALNIGCDTAAGNYLVMASAHVYPVYDSWIEHLIEPFSDPRVALVYGKQRGNGQTKFSEHQVFSKWFPDESISEQAHPFCNNANAAVRREIWRDIPYDEELTGLEDLDWAKRALAAGYSICYTSEAEIIHVHEETPRHILNRYRREAIALKKIMPDQRFTFGDFLRLFLSNTFSDYDHALQERAFLKNVLSIPTFRLMQFWGTFRGHAQHGPVTKQLQERFYYPREAGPKRSNGLPKSRGNEIEYGRAGDEGPN